MPKHITKKSPAARRTVKHDPARGDLCPCRRCDLERLASLAVSRRTSAVQQALWHPRSRRLRDEALRASEEYAKALAAHGAGTRSGRRR